MVATRRGAKRPVEEVEKIEQVIEVKHVQEEDSSDDEAPEEVTLSKGKQDAQLQRQQQLEAKKKASLDAKNRRKRQRRVQKPTESEENTEFGDVEDEEELDILPDDVLAAIAADVEKTDQRIKQRRIITEQLRTEKPLKTQHKTFTERHIGPITVKVLKQSSQNNHKTPSASAKAFLEDRFRGNSVKRSNEMLQSTKIGGMFIYGRKIV